MNVKKRDNKIENFDINKIKNAIKKTFNASNTLYTDGDLDIISQRAFELFEQEIIDQPVCIEKIQDSVVLTLMRMGYEYEAMAYTTYRSKHESLRLIKSRAEFIEKYSFNGENAATSSEIDANANIQNKNVATLEAEIYKDLSTQVSRYRVVKKLKELYGDEAPDYVSDLQSHVIYKHDESAPAIKPYCMAVSLYPFINKGTATIDKLNTSAPKNLTSFAGQFNNLIFLLSSQVQGAVAAVEFFNIMSYYCVKEWGKGFYMYDSKIVEQKFDGNKSISDVIEQTFQNIVYTLNQPAGNRSYQSPFTNISYFDSNYWHAMFGEFAFPDGTKLDWGAVDYLQQKFIRWFNAERKKCLLTFPVETMALLSDGTDVIDKEYKALTAEMYAEGHSFFTYLSDNADSLSSCCRLKNVLDKPEFNFTNGLTGVATGSKSVITLNLNRIIQDWYRKYSDEYDSWFGLPMESYLLHILENVYKYHIAYNELLWELYDAGMMPVYSAGYISLNQQFLTIGINGLNEAAEFLGVHVSDNEKYNEFCNRITSTISDANRKHEDHKAKHKLKFNCEFVPAESLAVKNYNWDKADDYWVPEDRNCYNSYFYKPDDKSISVLEKFRLHGKRYVDSLDGGVALHCNLEEHLTKDQYTKLIEYAVKEGTNYFTFNIPNTQCDDCGHISKSQLEKCPICNSENVTQWTRIIGYLRPIKAFSAGRKEEAEKRIYSSSEINA